MQAHRYAVGDMVHFTPGAFDQNARRGSYRVLRHLPAEGADNQYRIKSSLDGHERVVKESQLD
jgi:hypothetical protein